MAVIITNKRRCIITAIIMAAVNFGIASSFEFDERILAGMGIENIDLSAFSGSNDAFAGEYFSNVSVNGETLLYDQSIYIYTKDEESLVCFTEDLINRLPLKKNIVGDLKTNIEHTTDAGECLGLESLDSAIDVVFDGSTQRLDITMPHLFLDNTDLTWVPPDQRESGIAGIFTDYSLIMTHDRGRMQKQSQTTYRGNGVVGANWGKIRFRGNFQYDSKANTKKYEWSQRYAFMDVGSLNSKIYAGEIYSRSSVFNTVSMKGISLFSDENMMPAYLQGYAPQVTGTVGSNSIVTIKQNGGVIRMVQVPPGPFAISDLPSSLSGTVDVEIEEANGDKRSYQVDIAQVPFLTRKGAVRYSANVGKLRSFDKNMGTNIVSADASYGLTNDISVFGGAIFTTNRKYQAANLGLGFNLGVLGAISFDVTRSENKEDQLRNLVGHSFRFNYAKKFGHSTSLNLVGYRFSSRNYTSITNYVDMQTNSRSFALEKNRVTVSLSQRVDAIDSSLSVSMTKGSYWNKENISNYSITLSRTVRSGIFQNTTVQFSYMKNTSFDGFKEGRYGVFLTIPINNSYTDRIQYDGFYSDNSRNISQQATYHTTMLGGSASIGGTADNNRDFSGSGSYSLNASYDRDFSFGRTYVTGNYTSDYQRVSASLDGSITLTQHGVATHKRVYDDQSRLIVNVGAPGVTVGSDTESNIFGMAGISNVPSYYRSTYIVDNDNLPDNVDVPDSVINVAVSEGAIAYRSLGAITGVKAISIISLTDGTHPPFGSIVYRKNGKDSEVAMVADNGLTYLTGINKNSEFIVKWGGGASSCRLKVESLTVEALEKLTCYMD